MITSLRLINFRNHVDTTLALQPLNLLIGPVAAGKSSVFRAFVVIQNSIHRTLVELFPPGLGEFHWVRSRWANETDPIGFEIELSRPVEGDSLRYTLKIADSPAGLYVLYEALEQRSGDEDWRWVFKREPRRKTLGEFGEVDAYEPTLLHRVWHLDPRVQHDASTVGVARDVARALSKVGYFHLQANDLKSLGTGQPRDRIDYTGACLPDFVAWAKGAPEQMPVFEAILNEMKDLLPGLNDIIVTQTQTERQGIAMSFDGQRGFIAAPDLSDGTMFTLGLLCVLRNPRPPALLCIEEPETGLHPRRLRWLFDHFVRLAYAAPPQPNAQIILSTHSPDVVDLFADLQDAVQIVEERQGRAQVTSMSSIRRQLHDSDADDGVGRLWAAGLFEKL